jgi:tryptophan synthase alpha chain
MNGIERIANAFQRAKDEGRAALMPYMTLGYPTPETSLDVVKAIASAGVDLIELGVPFSDPLADGPTIQHSTQVALAQGMTSVRCLEMVTTLRNQGITQPFLLMGYINPILAYGPERYLTAVEAAGADGLIIPDLPPEEAADIESACRQHGLALVYLIPPTASLERIQQVAARSSGFIYLVSLTGVTGARRDLPADLETFIRRVRPVTHLPLAVGFGISTPQQVKTVSALADGVIVGSALVEAVGKASLPGPAAAAFIRALKGDG